MPAMTIRSCALLATLASVLFACAPTAQTQLDVDYVAIAPNVHQLGLNEQGTLPDPRSNSHSRPDQTSALIVSRYEENRFTGKVTVDWESHLRPNLPGLPD